MYDNLFFFLSFSQGLLQWFCKLCDTNSNIFFNILSQMGPKGF